MGIGYIYILSNSAMPGLVKIGFTYRSVEDRLGELSSATGVPAPFVIEYFCVTCDVEDVEKELHSRYSSLRRPGREFFAVAVADAVTAADSLVRPVKQHRFCRVNPTKPETPKSSVTFACICGEQLSIPPLFQRLVRRVAQGAFPRLRCPRCGTMVHPYLRG